MTLGLIRVVYGQDARSVVLLARPLRLLRFDPPEYLVERDRGRVTWPIRDGLLVAITEQRTRADIDRLAEVLAQAVAAERHGAGQEAVA